MGYKNAYEVNKYAGMSPERIVLAMYDGALNQLSVAAHAVDDAGRKGTAVSKALAIVAELQASLNPEAGELTERLLNLYDYVLRAITDGNVRNDPAKFEEASTLLRTVRSAWEDMIREAAEVDAKPLPPAAVGGSKRYV